VAYPTEVDAVQTAPTGNLGTTSPTHRALHDQYRTALLSIKTKINSLPASAVVPAGSSLATVQAAINALDVNFAGTVVLAPGEYDWPSGSLAIRSNLKIDG
jgi:hypothetical protein